MANMDGNVSGFSYFLPAEGYPSERVGAVGALIETWEPLRAAIDAVASPLFLVNEARQIVYTNPAFRQMFPPEEADGLLGRRVGDVFECRNSTTAPSGCGTGMECRRCRITAGFLTALRWGGSQFSERLDVLTEGPQEVPVKARVESVIVGNERLLFCVSGAQHVHNLDPDLAQQAPAGLIELALLLASGGPFCPA